MVIDVSIHRSYRADYRNKLYTENRALPTGEFVDVGPIGQIMENYKSSRTIPLVESIDLIIALTGQDNGTLPTVEFVDLIIRPIEQTMEKFKSNRTYPYGEASENFRHHTSVDYCSVY